MKTVFRYALRTCFKWARKGRKLQPAPLLQALIPRPMDLDAGTWIILGLGMRMARKREGGGILSQAIQVEGCELDQTRVSPFSLESVLKKAWRGKEFESIFG